MNTHFLSPLQWLILLYGSTWKSFHLWKTLYHVPQGSSIPGKAVLPWTSVSILAVLLDQTMNTHFLISDQWHVVLTDSIWKPFHLWKALYHRPQVSATPGKSLLPRIAVSILTISTGSRRVLHTFTIYFALLLSMSFLLCFNIGLDSFSITVLSEKNDKLGLCSEDGQMSSFESQFHDLGVYIDSDLGRCSSCTTL